MTGPVDRAIVSIPAQPSSYALHLVLDKPLSLEIGRLGRFEFPAGSYLYFGSAKGPGGLKARLDHHFKPAPRPHWNIDWLRSRAQLFGGWYSTAPGDLECWWSQALSRLPGVIAPAPGFGSADCRNGCPAHLLAFPEGLESQPVEAVLQNPVGSLISIHAFMVLSD